MTQAEVLAKLHNVTAELEARYGIEQIALFGSYAKNENHKESDIDIAVLKMEQKNAFTLIKAKNFLSDYLEQDVDLGLLDSLRPFVRKRVEQEMIYVA